MTLASDSPTAGPGNYQFYFAPNFPAHAWCFTGYSNVLSGSQLTANAQIVVPQSQFPNMIHSSYSWPNCGPPFPWDQVPTRMEIWSTPESPAFTIKVAKVEFDVSGIPCHSFTGAKTFTSSGGRQFTSFS